MLSLTIPTLLLACNGAGGGNGNLPGGPVDPGPTITMTTPDAGGDYYGDTVTATFAVDEFTLNAEAMGGANVEGEGHVHAYVDGVLVGETADTTFDFIGLPSGKRTLEVRLANNDHSEEWEGSWVWENTLDSRVSILSPIDGTQYSSSSAPLVLAMTDFTTDSTTAFADPGFGQGRYNVLLDDQEVDYGFNSAAVEVTQIPEGTHTVTVQLATSDGVPLDPPVEDSVDVEVLPGSPFVGIDRSAFLGEYNSATVPLNVTIANSPQEYHVYVDGVYYTGSTASQVLVSHLSPGYHYVELRLTNSGSELPIRDHVNINVAPTRPDVTITFPGDQWGTHASFDLTSSVENFTLDQAAMGGANEDGHGHLQLLVDGVMTAESGTSTVSVSNLPSGPHTLELDLVNNDGTPLDPMVGTSIHVTSSGL